MKFSGISSLRVLAVQVAAGSNKTWNWSFSLVTFTSPRLRSSLVLQSVVQPKLLSTTSSPSLSVLAKFMKLGSPEADSTSTLPLKVLARPATPRIKIFLPLIWWCYWVWNERFWCCTAKKVQNTTLFCTTMNRKTIITRHPFTRKSWHTCFDHVIYYLKSEDLTLQAAWNLWHFTNW